MFALPALIVPFLFCLAIYRLWQTPRRIWRGELRPPLRHRRRWIAAVTLAYTVLLAYTAGSMATLTCVLYRGGNQISLYVAILPCAAAYPVVYFAAG